MNCATPTDFNFSFRGFARRGGDTDKHQHGWGVAIYEGRGLRTFLDPLPAAQSKVAEFVQEYPMKTLNMMAHVRYATQGTVSLENVHPFQREMWGIYWSFSHNGEVPKYSNKPVKDFPLLGRTKREDICFHPVGDTDSEAVFCALLNALRAEFSTLPTLPVLYETIQRFCAEIIAGEEDCTILNFLLGCGEYTMFSFSWPGARPGSTVWNGLFYTIRRPPFSTAKLADVDYSVDFSQCTSPNDRVAVIATAPLTVDEEWTEFKRGQLLMFNNGLPFSELYDCHEMEQQGRGLNSRVLERSSTKDCARNYDTPMLLHQLVGNVVGDDRKNTQWARRGADLGCGAGCSGVAFRSSIFHMVGVDLSPEMIDKARERGCYDRLVVGDIECILRRDDSSADQGCPERNTETMYDLVFACGVFVYISDLRCIFSSVRNSLAPGGLFAFSAEVLEGDGEQSVVLQSCARFAHERSYVEGLAAEFGFETKAKKETSSIRKHGRLDVKGILMVLQSS
jgi:glutamine amidotransferase